MVICTVNKYTLFVYPFLLIYVNVTYIRTTFQIVK